MPSETEWALPLGHCVPFFCPAGVEQSPSSLPLRDGSMLPRGCTAPRRLLAPARCAPRLPQPRPSSSSRAGAPRCSHEAASPTPRRSPRAGSPRSRETWPLAPAWRIEYHHPQNQGDSVVRLRPGFQRDLLQVLCEREGGSEIRPAGDTSHCAEACGHRAARPAGGDADPDRAFHARKGNSEGPHVGLCLLGRTRRRVGGLRSMRSPSDRS